MLTISITLELSYDLYGRTRAERCWKIWQEEEEEEEEVVARPGLSNHLKEKKDEWVNEWGLNEDERRRRMMVSAFQIQQREILSLETNKLKYI